MTTEKTGHADTTGRMEKTGPMENDRVGGTDHRADTTSMSTSAPPPTPTPGHVSAKAPDDAPRSVPGPPPESGPRGASHSNTSPIPERTAPTPDHGRFLTGSVENELQARWSEIQASFVDGPKHAVQEADELVAELADQVAKAVRARHGLLRASWESSPPDTEEYRVALQRYRSFVNRLVAI
jgi:hypothetical protein